MVGYTILELPFHSPPHYLVAVFENVRFDFQGNMTTSSGYLAYYHWRYLETFAFEHDITLVGTLLPLGDMVFRPSGADPVLLEGAVLNLVATPTMGTGLHFPEQIFDLEGVQYRTTSGFQMRALGEIIIPGARLLANSPIDFPFGDIGFSSGSIDFYGVTSISGLNFRYFARPYSGVHPVTGEPEKGIQLIGHLQLPNILSSFEVVGSVLVIGDEVRINEMQFGNSCDDDLDIIANTRNMVLSKLKINIPDYCFSYVHGPPAELEASGSFDLEGVVNFGMELLIVDMMIDRLYGYIDEIAKPLGTSGAFLQRAGLFVENIAGAVKFATESEFCRMAVDLHGNSYLVSQSSHSP